MDGKIHRSYGSREIDAITDLQRRLPWSGFVWALAFLYIIGTPPFGIFFSELFVLRGMIQTANWFFLFIFLALLMVISIGMSRAVRRKLHTPGRSSAPAVSDRERLNLSHALGLYAVAASRPPAGVPPAAFFVSIHPI